MTRKIFITATDTDAGKTHFCRALIRQLVKHNFKVAAYKPISAGCEEINGTLVNDDARLLLAEVNTQQTLLQVNPIAFKEPIAPHIAAKYHQIELNIDKCLAGYQEINRQFDTDFIITEGAGGWRLPLGNNVFLSEFAVASAQEVILVVNIKLGCLNHAILTYETILSDGLKVIGWVANCQDQTMLYRQDNIEELLQLIDAPLLATFNDDETIESGANKIDVDLFVKR